MTEFNFSSSTMISLLSASTALSVAGLAWWVGWMFLGKGEDMDVMDARKIGVIALMIPVARRLGRLVNLVHLMPVDNYTRWAERQLRISGLDAIFTPKEYVGSHLVLLLIGAMFPVFLFLYPDFDVRQIVALCLILGGVLFALPFFYLKKIIDERRRSIFNGLPYFLDLLTLLVEAGEEFTLAMDHAATHLQAGPLQREIKRFCKQLALGTTRRQALDELADRIDLMQVRSFVTALIQQEELGSPLGKVLRTQADLMRFERVQYAEERANKAPVQILLPMVLFIFPSVFLVLIGPMIIRSMAQFNQ